MSSVGVRTCLTDGTTLSIVWPTIVAEVSRLHLHRLCYPAADEPGVTHGRAGTPQAFRLGPRGRGTERRRGGLRARARAGPVRHDADAERECAAPRRDHAAGAARHRAGLACVRDLRPLRP